MESIILPIHEKGEKLTGLSPLSTSYKMLSNNLFSRLSRYLDGIIEDHLYGFLRNR
jgi:hypothetical protein